MKNENTVIVYTMPNCPYCTMAKKLLASRGVSFQEILVPLEDEAQWDALYELSKMRTMPQIFAGKNLIGGYSDLVAQDRKDNLLSLKNG